MNIERTACRANSLGLAASAVILLAGCRGGRQPLEPTPVPSADDEGGRRITNDPVRPLPLGAGDPQMNPPSYDLPLTNAPPPEAPAFVDAYNAVGRPKIAVFVNRTLEGSIVPTTEEQVLAGRRRVVETTGAMDASRSQNSGSYEQSGGYYGGGSRERNTDREERLSTSGPARIEDRTEVYLPAGQYDELWASRVDYDALENALVDALSVGGEVVVLSPKLVRERMTAEDLAALQAGRPAVLDGLAQRLGADVLVQVQARPTAQTDRGLDLRIVAEALNTAGGESLGRANADFHPPMSAARLDRVSRYLARPLMDDMTGAWLTPAAPSTRPGEADVPSTTETPQ